MRPSPAIRGSRVPAVVVAAASGPGKRRQAGALPNPSSGRRAHTSAPPAAGAKPHRGAGGHNSTESGRSALRTEPGKASGHHLGKHHAPKASLRPFNGPHSLSLHLDGIHLDGNHLDGDYHLPNKHEAQEPIRQLVLFEDLSEQLLDESHVVNLPAAEAVQLVNFSNKNVDRLVSSLGASPKLWRRMLVLHEWLLIVGHTPDTRLCTTMMRVCLRYGEALRSLTLYDWMQGRRAVGGSGLTPDVYTYTVATKAALRAGQPGRALQVWVESQQAGCVPDSHFLAATIDMYIQLEQPLAGLEVFYSVASHIRPSVHVFNLAMKAATRGGCPERALDIWDDMQTTGLAPSVHAYTSAMSACAALGLSNHALRLHRELISRGLKSDSHAYTALIVALGSRQQAKRCLKVLRHMLGEGVKPTCYTYAAVISAMIQAGHTEDALRLMHAMQSPQWGSVKPNAIIYSIVLKGLGERGRFKCATQLFLQILEASGASAEQLDELFDQNMEPMEEFASLQTCEAQTSQETAGLQQDGMPMTSHSNHSPAASPSRTFRPESLEDTMVSSWLGGPPRNSGGAKNQIVNDIVCGTMISVCARCGRWKAALRLLRWLSIGAVPGVEVNTTMLNACLSALCKAQQWQLTEGVYESFEHLTDQVSRETLVTAYGYCGKVQEAERVVKNMLAAREIPRDYAFCGIIEAYKLQKRPRAALNVRARMRALDVPVSVHVYNHLLDMCATCQMWNKALELSYAMKREGVEPNATSSRLLAVVREKGMQKVEEQQATAAALSAAAMALLMRTGMFY